MESPQQLSRTRTTRLFTRTISVSLLLIVLFFFIVLFDNSTGYLRPGPTVSFTFYQGNVSTTSIANLSIVNNELPVQKPYVQRKERIPEVMDGNEKTDGQKVALMFLSLGELHNEPVWAAFFEAAGRLKFRLNPQNVEEESYVHGYGKAFFNKVNDLKEGSGRSLKRNRADKKRSSQSNCQRESRLVKRETERLLSGSDEKDVISRQNLFTVYTHPHPSYRFPETSIFYGTEIQNRIDTNNAWGTFRLVAAEVWLLRFALKDKNNQRFALLSESCIPLYRPEMIFLQLMSETKSRINSCHPYAKKNKLYRWNHRMQTKYMKRWKWRFSSQWFALKRSHAEIVANDVHVRRQFRRSCLQTKHRLCIPDEHYMPTALAVYNVSNETDCIGKMTALWRGKYRSHAITFPPKYVSARLFDKLKRVDQCYPSTSLASTKKIFTGGLSDRGCLNPVINNTIAIASNSEDNWVIKSGYVPMNYGCSIFARKFPKVSLKKTVSVALSCSGVGLGYWC